MQPYPPDPVPAKPLVSGSHIQIEQEGDSNDGELQVLRLNSEDAGGGHFFTLSTDRWAFDTIGEFIETLQAIDARLPKCCERLTPPKEAADESE